MRITLPGTGGEQGPGTRGGSRVQGPGGGGRVQGGQQGPGGAAGSRDQGGEQGLLQAEIPQLGNLYAFPKLS